MHCALPLLLLLLMLTNRLGQSATQQPLKVLLLFAPQENRQLQSHKPLHPAAASLYAAAHHPAVLHYSCGPSWLLPMHHAS
jgi:hypothetical protein